VATDRLGGGTGDVPDEQLPLRFKVVSQKSTPPQIRQLSHYFAYVKNELTGLRGNGLLQHDFKNTLCEIRLTGWGGGPGDVPDEQLPLRAPRRRDQRQEASG